jgi:two-component system NtrC family sensor kinase
LHVFLYARSYSFIFSQSTPDTILYINKIPSEGILLDKGWKFHAGDSREWVKPEYDDKNWGSINPTLDIRDIPSFKIIRSIGLG